MHKSRVTLMRAVSWEECVIKPALDRLKETGRRGVSKYKQILGVLLQKRSKIIR